MGSFQHAASTIPRFHAPHEQRAWPLLIAYAQWQGLHRRELALHREHHARRPSPLLSQAARPRQRMYRGIESLATRLVDFQLRSTKVPIRRS